jgi:cytochrome c oxidase subunit 2
LTPRTTRSFLAIVAVLEIAVPPPALPADSVKEFEITASRFAFEPEAIEVTEGDRVRLTLRSADTTHGIAIGELKVKAKIPKGGAPVTTEFVASKPGTFVIKCSEYCGPGHKKMLGRLVVVPKGGQ